MSVGTKIVGEQEGWLDIENQQFFVANDTCVHANPRLLKAECNPFTENNIGVVTPTSDLANDLTSVLSTTTACGLGVLGLMGVGYGAYKAYECCANRFYNLTKDNLNVPLITE